MADNNQIIAATVQVNTGNSNANIKEVKKNLTDVKGALNETGAAAKATAKDLEGAGGSFSKIREQLAAVSPATAGATEGVAKLNTGFKALLANPIVALFAAIVAVLTLVYSAFKNSFEGGEKLEQVFAGIKAVGQSLLDSLDKIGSSIVKLFKFDFSGAIADMKEVGTAAANAFNAMSKLTAEAQNLKREQLANDLDAANRAKQLAVLREQATDEDVPLAKRKAALKELQAAAEQNSKEDIDLAKRTAANKIAQLTLEKDGEKKNAEEITKIKIEQVNVETDNANELRRINKQLTAANKAELAERTANAKEAAEKQKADREKLNAFNTQLTKLQQDNELLIIKGGYEKELQQLEFKIADEKRANALAFNDKKITKAQFNEIEAAEKVKADLQRAAITEKHNTELAAKELAFQKDLVAITTKTKLAGITDSRELEKVQLKIGYEEKLQQAIVTYKDDTVRFQQIKNALDEQLKAEQEKVDAKNKKEDDKKKFLADEQAQKDIIAKKVATKDEKLQAIADELALDKAAFDNKIITEQEYNARVEALAGSRKAIRDKEIQEIAQASGATADLLSGVSEAIGATTAAGKTFAIAAAILRALQAEISIISGLSEVGPFGFVAGIAAAAAVGVQLFTTINKMKSVPVPAGGGGISVPSAPSYSVPAQTTPIAPTQATTQLDAKSLNTIGNAASRVYVLDSDVKSNREKDERLNRAARLG